MAITVNTWPDIKADYKDAYSENSNPRFTKIKNALTTHNKPIKRCPKCGEYKCDCSEESTK